MKKNPTSVHRCHCEGERKRYRIEKNQLWESHVELQKDEKVKCINGRYVGNLVVNELGMNVGSLESNENRLLSAFIIICTIRI